MSSGTTIKQAMTSAASLAARQASVTEVTVPDWLERHIRDAGLRPDLAQAFRRMYVAAQAHGREVLAEAGVDDWEEYEAERRRRDIGLLLEQAGVPQRLRAADFSRDKMTRHAMQGAFEWVNGRYRGTCLVLAGPKRVGKSWAAAAVARMLIEIGHRVTWCMAVDVVADFKRGEVRGSMPAVCEVLVVDGLGSESPTDRPKLEILLTTRANARRTTIVTTRVRRDEWADKFGQEIDSVLHEWAYFVEIPGE